MLALWLNECVRVEDGRIGLLLLVGFGLLRGVVVDGTLERMIVSIVEYYINYYYYGDDNTRVYDCYLLLYCNYDHERVWPAKWMLSTPLLFPETQLR